MAVLLLINDRTDLGCQGYNRTPDNPTYGIPCNVTLVVTDPSSFGNVQTTTVQYVPNGSQDTKLRRFSLRPSTHSSQSTFSAGSFVNVHSA